MKEFTEGAFAKVNLTLDVLDKREDGYHNLRSIMQTVSLHDDVHVTVGCEGWQVHCYREILPPDAAETTEPELVTCGLPQDRDNLVWKAAEAFYARTGKTPRGWKSLSTSAFRSRPVLAAAAPTRRQFCAR